MSLAGIRREYPGQPFDEGRADADPLVQFERWFAEARDTEPDPTAMTLATAAPTGRPSARTVLLKGVDGGGFVFYTNYASRKAREIDAVGYACLLFFWPSRVRQVSVSGAVSKVTAAESDVYFASRPLDSRLVCMRLGRVRRSRVERRSRTRLPTLVGPTRTIRCLVRRGGAATALCQTRLSFGRGERAACTIVCNTSWTRAVGTAIA